MGKKRTVAEIEEVVNNLNYILLNTYRKNVNTRVIIENIDGYKYDIGLSDLIFGKSPQFIHQDNPYVLQNIALWLKINKKNFELCENNIYVRAYDKLSFYCYDCKNTFYMGWGSIKQGRCCSICAQERIESKVATECKQYFYDNYNAEPEYKLFKNPITNQWLKCDIYIPDNIYIEIHGPQHYINNKYYFKTDKEFEYRQYLDQIKKEYCQNNGIYIEVDLRKIKTTEQAISYIESILKQELSQYVH